MKKLMAEPNWFHVLLNEHEKFSELHLKFCDYTKNTQIYVFKMKICKK